MYHLDLVYSSISYSDSRSRFFYVLELLTILVLLHDEPNILSRPCVCPFRRLQRMRDPKAEISLNATLDLSIVTARTSCHTSLLRVEVP